ncbi:HNH endonuclease-domain-containing protein [Lipomyces starkeyi]
MPTSRSVIRNIQLFDPSRPIEPLGGLYLNSLRLGTITVTDERCIARALSRSVSTGRNGKFREQVQKRDGKCVITGVANPVAFIDEWASFEAAHIFPLSCEEQFRKTDTGMNSCQNGLLMRSSIHHLFGTFKFSIDPDDDYKITCFSIDMDGIDGRTLDPVCRDQMDERRVIDELLRWHFRQAILANMKGECEPVFKFDFPYGSDTEGAILSGRQPGERMEAELFLRLSSASSIS